MDVINAVSCIKAEINNVTTLLRLNTKWAGKRYVSATQIKEELRLVNLFKQLNEQLEGVFDIEKIDCVNYLLPFQKIIISEYTNGPLTNAALNALCKFVLYGFINPDLNINCKKGVETIAICISGCVFEESDWQSDEVIMLKLLELSSILYKSNSSALLTVEASWEIFSTCLSIHNQFKASKILLSEAETSLRHLTLTAFSKANNALKTFDNNSFMTHFTESIKGKSWDQVSISYYISNPIGITLLLGKIMTVLSNLMDSEKHSSEYVKFSLSLINVALEAGGTSLGSVNPLVDVLKGDICRHLLRASQSEDLPPFLLRFTTANYRAACSPSTPATP